MKRFRVFRAPLQPGWLYALSQCGLFVVLFIVFIVGMGMSA
ncbi:putative membrane protein [Escherichia coli P0299917.6]|nr:putative membrane protein [Escherichia coli P0299917.6]